MSSQVLQRFERAQESVRTAKAATAEAKAKYEEARAQEAAAEAEAAVAREALETTLARGEVRSSTAPARIDPHTPEPTVPPFIAALLHAIPDGGTISFADLEAALGLGDGATRSRLAKVKKLGLVESEGWGVYRLTPAGRDAKRLRVLGTGLPPSPVSSARKAQ